MTSLGETIRRRVLGLVFLLALVSLMGLSVAVYQKAFTPVIWVTLHTNHTGLQLNEQADVKLRGALVGEVRKISADGERATLRLAIDPEMVAHVPANVTARLLPKTLFGEKYVALDTPADPSPKPIGNEDVIAQDRTETALEFERALEGVLPLLQAVEPDKLAATLTATARALEGRGEQLGRNLVELGDYLAALNKEMPTIREDIRRLANVLETYDRAAPDLVDLLDNLSVTMGTVNEQKTQLRSFFASAADLGDHTRFFFEKYGARIIQLGEVSEPVMNVLARYSPQTVCMVQGLKRVERSANETFSNGRFNVLLEITQHQGRYEKGADEPPPPGAPRESSHGPNCRGLPNPPVPFPPVEPGDTGYDWGRPRSPLPVGLPPPPSLGRAADSSMTIDPTMGYAGTDEEKLVIKPLLASATDTPATEVSDLAVLLWGPMMRGAQVNLK
ncbi:MAG: MCE family protein [Micromonosporaceae bacterium]